MRVRDKQEMTKHFSDSIKLRTNSLKIRDPPASEPLGASTIRCVLGCSDVRSDGGGGGGGGRCITDGVGSNWNDRFT
jgi:hypothetical protein